MNTRIRLPKGIIFDMDGVLLLTTQRSEQSWHLVCQQFAPVLNLSVQRLEAALQESLQEYSQEIQQDEQKQRRDRLEPFETRKETVAQALKRVARGKTALAAEMVHAYEALRDEHRQLTPHAQETLQELQNRGFPLALISNGNARYQRQKIERYHLAPFFDSILIEEEFGCAKPDPRIFLAALSQLHISQQEAWMIGDDLARDIAPSHRLGMFAIWFDPAKSGLPAESSSHPDHSIHELSELLDLLSGTFVSD